jgi:hypothetical protein
LKPFNILSRLLKVFARPHYSGSHPILFRKKSPETSFGLATADLMDENTPRRC